MKWIKINESYDDSKTLCDVDTLIKRLQIVSHRASNPRIKCVGTGEDGYPELWFPIGPGAYDSVPLKP